MLRKTLLAVGCLLSVSGSSAAKTYILGDHRPAKLLTPESASDVNKVPLLVFLHGFSSDAQQSDDFFGISKQRDRLGFAILLPDGTINSLGSRFGSSLSRRRSE